MRELDIMYPGATYLTIMFISSCRIIYRGSCEDYIFPVTEEYPRGSGRYRKGDPRARPLACIDWNEVCTNSGVCKSTEEEYEENGIAEGSYALIGIVKGLVILLLCVIA